MILTVKGRCRDSVFTLYLSAACRRGETQQSGKGGHQIGFTQSISSGFRRYFDFNTRSSRSEFWWWQVFAVLVGLATIILDGLFFGWETMESSWSPLNTLATLTLFIPGLAVSVRRLHDVERSGWWILICFTIIGIIFPYLYWAVQPSGYGTNKYGPAPTAPFNSATSQSEECASSTQDRARSCGECGSELNSGDNFCPECGKAV